jgi:hypothetical protein
MILQNRQDASDLRRSHEMSEPSRDMCMVKPYLVAIPSAAVYTVGARTEPVVVKESRSDRGGDVS